MTNDTALLFSHAISQYLKLNEEYRTNWRYKHVQERIKAPRREAFKNANQYAETIRQYMEICAQPNTIERYAGKLYIAWDEYKTAMDANISATDTEKPKTLQALKDAETALKQHIRQVNTLINNI